VAYELVFEELYPEARRWTGIADKFSANMTALSGMSFITPVIGKVIEWFPPEGIDKLIRIRIWQDKEPFWTDLYKLEVIAHSSPVAWSTVVVALAALIGIAIISWTISQVDWKMAGLPLAILGIGLILLALRRKK